MTPSLLITQCLQNDFVQPVGRFDPLPNKLHIGHEEARRLMGDHPAEGPVARTIDWANKQDAARLAIIHIRDWHDPKDPAQTSHLQQFGLHCIHHTPGAGFVFELPKTPRAQTAIVDSFTLNDFHGTTLQDHLLPFKGKAARVGLMGVWTEAKVTYLAYELATRFPQFQIGVCSALTASSSRAHHFMALDQLNKLLGVQIFSSVGQFIQFLGGDEASTRLPLPVHADHPTLEIDSPQALTETDHQLLRYLFRDCKKAHFKCLDGGFSGNVVLGSESVDLMGHPQVPHVVKIGKQDLIGRERAAFEQVEPVLGNNAPHIADFADFADRGAIKYRYAAMGGGASTTFQKRYMAGLTHDKVQKILSTVFVEQLGRFYQAASREKCNLLEYYAFSPDKAPRVRERVEGILGARAVSPQLRLSVGPDFPNVCLFYEADLPRLLPAAEASNYFAYVHGDLNGANIIIDTQENVWLIDFFHTHRGHILQDLLKFENDLLYIMTPVTNESDLRQALSFTDQLLAVQDLSKPLPDLDPAGFSAPFQRAWATIKILRSFYPALVETDRSPLQAWMGQMRYAVHTLSFEESNLWQKKWALYTAGHCGGRITEQILKDGPLRIDWIEDPLTAPGRLGLTILPGRRDYRRDLALDIQALKRQDVTHVACLLPDVELRHYGVGSLMSDYRAAGFQVTQTPILDQKTTSFQEMRTLVDWITTALKSGGRVLVHCTGGLGRSGMAAACVLKSRGLSGDQAILEIRRARSQRAIETTDQEEFVRQFKS